jgi:hypothetical protein
MLGIALEQRTSSVASIPRAQPMDTPAFALTRKLALSWSTSYPFIIRSRSCSTLHANYVTGACPGPADYTVSLEILDQMLDST